ncbi:MAG TPA: hypothetical protein VM307_09235 [Egibacteraceae bacterium]|nr:hypothetical protein [Egibacteraceae bacterium]
MKLRLFLVSLFVLALAVPGFASAQAPVLVTGGGQVLASFDATAAGPGDQVAFIGDAGRQTGSIQVTQTSKAAEGQRPPIIYNGQVTCVNVDGDDRAILGGVKRAGQGGPEFFELEVRLDTEDDDGRSGATIIFRNAENGEECDGEDEESLLDPNRFLARGTAKIDTARSGR